MGMNLPEIIATDKPLHPDESLHGSNSYYFHCPATERNAEYFVCHHVGEAFRAGALKPDMFPACQKAIPEGRCLFIYMRAEELAQGKALFYKVWNFDDKEPEKLTRPERVDYNSASYKRGRYGTKRQEALPPPKPKKEKKVAKPKADETPHQMDLSKLVNQIAAEEPKTDEKPGPLPGESVKDFVLRTKGGKK